MLTQAAKHIAHRYIYVKLPYCIHRVEHALLHCDEACMFYHRSGTLAITQDDSSETPSVSEVKYQ